MMKSRKEMRLFNQIKIEIDKNKEGKRPMFSDDEEGPKLLRVEHDQDEEEFVPSIILVK